MHLFVSFFNNRNAKISDDTVKNYLHSENKITYFI